MRLQITEEENRFENVWEFLRYVKKQFSVDEEMQVITDDVNKTITISVNDVVKKIPEEEIPF